MIPARQAPTQTLVIRASAARSLDPIIAAMADLTEQRVVRIVDLRIVAADNRAAAVALTLEHVWWPRLLAALAEAHAELVTDVESPKAGSPASAVSDQLAQITQLNELRKAGTLTEGEFALAKRTLLAKEGLVK